jgi:O-succinylbenzoate synthase
MFDYIDTSLNESKLDSLIMDFRVFLKSVTDLTVELGGNSTWEIATIYKIYKYRSYAYI